MKKIKKEEMAGRDVELARRISLITIEIDRNFEIKVLPNEDLLNSFTLGGRISVIGPDENLDKVLLMEIGISRSRPYNAGWILATNGRRKWFRKRENFFKITEEQYRAVSPLIFKFIQSFADKRVAKWKCNHSNPYNVKVTKRRWSHRKKRMYYRGTTMSAKLTTRFSINKEDYLIVRDIFSAELEFNKALRIQLGGLARFVDKRLKRHRSRGYKGRKNFCKLKAAQDIRDAACRWPNYLKIEMLKHLPEGRRNYFFRQLADLFNWNGIDETPEREFAGSALCDTGNRIGKMQLRIVSAKNGYIVFEIEARPLAG